jgi:hypothetical protein
MSELMIGHGSLRVLFELAVFATSSIVAALRLLHLVIFFLTLNAAGNAWDRSTARFGNRLITFSALTQTLTLR